MVFKITTTTKKKKMTGQAVKVKRGKIEACIKCPICNKLLKEATTISLCLHTFCRKCIYKKLSVDKVESCPVCNIDLGCVPEEKLRSDHNLQDVRSKIFPFKRRKINSLETLPFMAIPPPVKRKERSLSSLGFIAASKLSSPLTPLLEASNGTKFHKGISISKTEPSNILEGRAKVEHPVAPCIILGLSNTKSKGTRGKTKSRDNKNEGSSLTGPVKRKRFHKKATTSEDLSHSMQLLVDASSGKCNRQNLPIWFSLVASKDQKGEFSLPQVSTCFLRIKDGSVPVSIIQKYIVQKLCLNSESEVEILCQGQAVLPTLQLHHVLDFWFRTDTTTKQVSAKIGTSAKDFVMVLSYCRKVQPP